MAAVRLGVKDAGPVAFPRACFAEVGEPEAASRVEDDVVGAAKRDTVGVRIENLHLPGIEIDALDAAAAVVRRLTLDTQASPAFHPVEATVVADVALAVGTDGGAIRPPASLGHDRDFAGLRYPR